MSARSERRFHERSRTFLQLAAYLSILALMGLAGRELHADVTARVLRQAAAQSGACGTCRPSAGESAPSAPASGVDWIAAASTPALRASFTTD